MSKRCVVITGSSSGIGKAIAVALLNSGNTVIGLSRDHKKFRLSHKNFFPYETNLQNLGSLQKIVSEICSRHTKIDSLISNAGYGKFKMLENFSPKEINSFFNVNLLSHIILTRLFLPSLKRTTGLSNIIFVGSEAALRGSKKATLYSVSKFGLRGFAQALRYETSSKNVGVTIINPGMVRTSFFENLEFRPGKHSTNAIEPSDIAELVLNILKVRSGTVIDEINLSPLNKVIKFK